MKDILSQQRDNTALIDRVIKKEDDLYALKDKMQNVESFFKTLPLGDGGSADLAFFAEHIRELRVRWLNGCSAVFNGDLLMTSTR